MGLPRRDHVVVGLRLLEHAPHRVDVVAREPPVAPRFEIAEPELAGAPQLYACDPVAHLARHELATAALALVVEENAGAREEPVALPVVDRDEVTVDLRDAVRAPRMERRGLALGCLAHLPEHLAGARLVEAHARRDEADGLE